MCKTNKADRPHKINKWTLFFCFLQYVLRLFIFYIIIYSVILAVCWDLVLFKFFSPPLPHSSCVLRLRHSIKWIVIKKHVKLSFSYLELGIRYNPFTQLTSMSPFTRTVMVAELPCNPLTRLSRPVHRRSQGFNWLISRWPTSPREAQPTHNSSVSFLIRAVDTQGSSIKCTFRPLKRCPAPCWF